MCDLEHDKDLQLNPLKWRVSLWMLAFYGWSLEWKHWAAHQGSLFWQTHHWVSQQLFHENVSGRSAACEKLQTWHQGNRRPSLVPRLPPSVAESRKCVPYFLMMLSVMAPRVGRLPSCLMVCRNSGSSGRAKPLLSCLSRARLFTFQRPNSLPRKKHGHVSHVSGRSSSELFKLTKNKIKKKINKNIPPVDAVGI